MTASNARPDIGVESRRSYYWPPLMRSGRQALYRQIADRLRHAIAAGATRLPTERRLAQDFSVARVTVRMALDVLANDQLISRRRRFGTLVINPRVSLEPISIRPAKGCAFGDGIDPH